VIILFGFQSIFLFLFQIKNSRKMDTQIEGKFSIEMLSKMHVL